MDSVTKNHVGHVEATPLPDQEELDARKESAATWFQSLRDRICAAFEAIEDDYQGEGEAGRFVRTPWQREQEGSEKGETGGGVMSVMKGRVFEKVGVNISKVHGEFSEDFAKNIPGASDDRSFFATGISLVAHMKNPHVPAVHMNTRFLVTSRAWFGGGADLNPPLPRAEDTTDFHAALKEACDRFDPDFYCQYKAWCDEYFMIKHRNRSRGVGGIFYDYLDSGDWQNDFAFTKSVGQAFLDIYPRIVRRRMQESWTEEDRAEQLRYRGLYAEFNLVYDRGTRFGLMTGGNVDAILMSLPPLARWD